MGSDACSGFRRGKAAELIDTREHRGKHSRPSATDVCPFVPMKGVTLEECAAIVRRLGRRVGDELAIPVYFYEAAATDPGRESLADVRRGEYLGQCAFRQCRSRRSRRDSPWPSSAPPAGST